MIRPPPRSPLFPYAPLFRSTASLFAGAFGCQGFALGLVTAHAGFSDIVPCAYTLVIAGPLLRPASGRSEEHTSELQSRLHLVCRLLLANKSFELASAMGIVT